MSGTPDFDYLGPGRPPASSSATGTSSLRTRSTAASPESFFPERGASPQTSLRGDSSLSQDGFFVVDLAGVCFVLEIGLYAVERDVAWNAYCEQIVGCKILDAAAQ